jgi:hypothetical protein
MMLRFEFGERTMLRAKFIAMLAAALLGGCACFNYSPKPETPLVSIVSKGGPGVFKPALTVYPDPLFFRKDQTNVRITWRLPEQLGLKFPANGIVIDGEITNKPLGDVGAKRNESTGPLVIDKAQTEIVDCAPSSNGQEFSCLYKHTRPGVFKYTIRVLNGSTLLDPLDPSVMGG